MEHTCPQTAAHRLHRQRASGCPPPRCTGRGAGGRRRRPAGSPLGRTSWPRRAPRNRPWQTRGGSPAGCERRLVSLVVVRGRALDVARPRSRAEAKVRPRRRWRLRSTWSLPHSRGRETQRCTSERWRTARCRARISCVPLGFSRRASEREREKEIFLASRMMHAERIYRAAADPAP